MQNEFDVSSWGAYARNYDALNELIPYKEMQTTILEAIEFQDGQIVLDAACGSGNLALWAEKTASLNGATIIGADFSEEMLQRARIKCGHIYDNLVRADLNSKIPFADSAFDTVVCTLTLYALENPSYFLQEISRVLKPNGKLILTTPKADYENGLILKKHCGDNGPESEWLNAHESPERERQLISRAIPDKILAQKIIAIAEYNRNIKNMPFYFPDQDELLSQISGCGFAIQNCRKVYADQDYLVIAKNRRNQ